MQNNNNILYEYYATKSKLLTLGSVPYLYTSHFSVCSSSELNKTSFTVALYLLLFTMHGSSYSSLDVLGFYLLAN